MTLLIQIFDTESTDSLPDDDSNKMAKWPGSPIGNISEIAKMVLALQAQKKRNDSQAAQSTNNDGSNVAPRADKVQLSNDPFDF